MILTSCDNANVRTNCSVADYEATETGLYYRFYEKNQGENPEMMMLLDVIWSCKINDTVVLIPENRTILKMMEPLFKGDVYEGIAMMCRGDSASFIVRTDSTLYTLFGYPSMPKKISGDDIMKFNIRLNDFYPESEFASKQIEYKIEYMKSNFVEETSAAEKELKDYLKNKNINVMPTESGLYYVKTSEGNGEKPNVGTLVKVHYTGKLMDETIFDSSVTRNEPFRFVLGIGQVIPGWDEGLQLMSKGEKGVLYIPYYLAYGVTGSGPVPPFANLIFEVELIDF